MSDLYSHTETLAHIRAELQSEADTVNALSASAATALDEAAESILDAIDKMRSVDRWMATR